MGVEVAAEVPPPYKPPETAGLVTVTGTVPEVVIAEFGIMAVSLDALTRVVAWAVPLKFILALAAKFVPSTSRGKDPLLAITLLGTRLEITGIVPGCGGMLAGLE